MGKKQATFVMFDVLSGRLVCLFFSVKEVFISLDILSFSRLFLLNGYILHK